MGNEDDNTLFDSLASDWNYLATAKTIVGLLIACWQCKAVALAKVLASWIPYACGNV